MPDSKKVLFLIVGKGDLKKPDYPESYLKLLRKAIDETAAETVVLLPSGSSQENAELIKSEYEATHHVFIENLPPKKEFDADECFKFFEDKFNVLFKQGFRPENFTIDFTHGTKAMSAALYAIGMRYRVSDFHYIQRNNDKDGNLIEGETIKVFDASYARGLSVLDQCKTLFKSWQFSAAKTLLETERLPKILKNRVNNVKMLADFYSAWDRLDYKTAKAEMVYFSIEGFEKFCPYSGIENWLELLSEDVAQADDTQGEVLSDDMKNKNALILGNILIDLYANTLRRIESGALEDASIRVYRIAEMIGQALLFKKGYVSNQMPESDDKVRFFAENNNVYRKKNTDIYEFGRKITAEFLKKISQEGDVFYDVASFLIERNKEIESLRNTSILIHGFSAKASTAEKMKLLLNDLLSQIKLIFGKEDVEEKLNMALFMNKFKDNN